MRNKDIPAAVRQTLLDHNITEYPVDLLQLSRRAGIKVIKDSDVDELSAGEYGDCLFHDNQWYIVYDDTRTLEQMRFTVGHELGHIFLKHNEEYDRFMKYIEDLKIKHSRKIERQADIFARHLLNTKGEHK